jgi:hypothetical protein
MLNRISFGLYTLLVSAINASIPHEAHVFCQAAVNAASYCKENGTCHGLSPSGEIVSCSQFQSSGGSEGERQAGIGNFFMWINFTLPNTMEHPFFVGGLIHAIVTGAYNVQVNHVNVRIDPFAISGAGLGNLMPFLYDEEIMHQVDFLKNAGDVNIYVAPCFTTSCMSEWERLNGVSGLEAVFSYVSNVNRIAQERGYRAHISGILYDATELGYAMDPFLALITASKGYKAAFSVPYSELIKLETVHEDFFDDIFVDMSEITYEKDGETFVIDSIDKKAYSLSMAFIISDCTHLSNPKVRLTWNVESTEHNKSCLRPITENNQCGTRDTYGRFTIDEFKEDMKMLRRLGEVGQRSFGLSAVDYIPHSWRV